MKMPTTKDIGASFRKEDSLPGKVERFFKKNPDEELTIDDIAVKFNCSRNHAQITAGRCPALVVEGDVVRRRV